jgi:endo-1,4-beta-xylanase
MLNRYSNSFSYQNFFGVDLPTRRRMVIALLICLVGLCPQLLFPQPLADGKSKLLGVATNSSLWLNLDKYWNQVTPGNDGKWESVEPVQGQYNWTNLDKIYNFAVGKFFPYKHHCLVWGNQQPSWITTLDSAGQRSAVENWIRLVGQRYPNMSFVDVVNEPFRGPAAYRNALGGNGKTGYDWVVTSFQWSRQYCSPGVKLILNEYNVLHDNAITSNMLRLIDTLKARNLIDGIGIQGHYFEFRSEVTAANQYVYSISTIKSNLDRLASTGIPIYISEFDIDEQVDSNQVAQYKIYFPIFWDHPGVKGITLWGYIQNDIWTSHPYTYLLLWDGTERPALQWMRSYVVPPPVPVLLSPATSSTGVARNPRLVWRSSESATSYGIQISSDINFSSIVLDLSVTDTVLNVFPLDSNKKFYWHVNAVNSRDTSDYSVTASFTTGNQIAAVKEGDAVPTEFQLDQNYPNPFNPSTHIPYSVPQNAYISLKVFNLLGEEVASLYEGVRPPGFFEVQFDGKELPTGVYLYRLKANNFVATRKLLLLK